MYKVVQRNLADNFGVGRKDLDRVAVPVRPVPRPLQAHSGRDVPGRVRGRARYHNNVSHIVSGA